MARVRDILRFLCAILAVCCVSGAPTLQTLTTPTSDELSFMTRYGYLPELTKQDDGDGVELSYTAHSISDAVVKMQAFAGIPQTGILDEETKKLFTKKRCGVKDIDNMTRRRRYVISQGWSNKTITYRVINGSRTLSKQRVEDLMAAALGVWAPHGGLHFVKKHDGPANIEVSFSTLDHGDMLAFDGPGQALAHAFGPPIGAMHFDDDENWIDSADADQFDNEDDFYEVTDLYAVAVHEAGHALGLYHSNVTSSVMYPYYQGTDQLDPDDITGMHELYMKEEQSTMSGTTESKLASPFTKGEEDSASGDVTDTDDDVPDICYTNYDTMQVIHGKIFVFEDEWVWVFSRRKIVEAGYPKKFHDVFIGLPKYVNLIRAIYERENGNVVIFSGREYWELDAQLMVLRAGDVSDYSVPATLSAAFLSNYNNKTYLIDEDRFWRYDERATRMDDGYPKSMAAWRQVPYPVDAALVWERDTYFFVGGKFWRFDNTAVRAHHYYPQPVAPVWFPCEFRTDLIYTTTH